jgi:predicted dehydrogenase
MLTVGILGCGKVAHLHAKAIAESRHCALAGVWSRTPATARAFARQYSVRAYDDITSLILKERIDFVVVCTPHPYHRQPAITALNAGAHVMVEKPLAASVADAVAMVERAEKRGLKISVISQRRWYPPARRIRDAIDAGKIGKPAIGTVQMLGWRDREYYDSDAWRGTWKHEGGGVLVNQAPHQFDLLMWYMGDVESLYGDWTNINHPYIEVEDTAMALLRFKGGGMGNIFVSNAQKPGVYGKVHIHGDNGASVGVQTESGAMFIAGMTGIGAPPFNDIWTVQDEERNLAQWTQEDRQLFESVDPTVYFIRLQLEDFCGAIREDRLPVVTPHQGVQTVSLFEGIYLSRKKNGSIAFPMDPSQT